MTAPTSKRAMRQLSVREKIDAVQRVHEGESKASVARQIGVPESTLRGWCKNEMKLKTMDKSGCSQSPSPSPPLEKRPRVDGGSDNDFDDSVWFWIRNQQKHEESQRVINNNNHHQSSWFWKWYKEVGVQQQPSAFALLHNPDEPLPLVKRKLIRYTNIAGAQFEGAVMGESVIYKRREWVLSFLFGASGRAAFPQAPPRNSPLVITTCNVGKSTWHF
ncbi:hypothetical protein J6590_051557 [Homalodisca vitripennis]|nr:hypothetical protein J6590_051557 [Homalodisca vitripennis]